MPKKKKPTESATLAAWAGVLIAALSLAQVLWTQPPWFLRRMMDESESRTHVQAEPSRQPTPALPSREPSYLPSGAPPSAPPLPAVVDPVPPSSGRSPASEPVEPEVAVRASYGPASATSGAAEPLGLAWGKVTFPLGVVLIVVALLVRRARRKAREVVTPFTHDPPVA